MDANRDDENRKPLTEHRNAGVPSDMKVRDQDLEPHEGLRYIARLFKILAILLILMLIGEAVLGLMRQGSAAIPTLLVEATRLIVFSGFLWGAADMALMFIESNHDLRATRILVGRLNARVQDLEVGLRGEALSTTRPAPTNVAPTRPTPPPSDGPSTGGGPIPPSSGGATPPPGF